MLFSNYAKLAATLALFDPPKMGSLVNPGRRTSWKNQNLTTWKGPHYSVEAISPFQPLPERTWKLDHITLVFQNPPCLDPIKAYSQGIWKTRDILSIHIQNTKGSNYCSTVIRPGNLITLILSHRNTSEEFTSKK